MKECFACGTMTRSTFCSRCGTKVVAPPRCNWCGEKMWKYKSFCPGCGRSRLVALNTEPEKSVIRKALEDFFAKLLGKE